MKSTPYPLRRTGLIAVALAAGISTLSTALANIDPDPSIYDAVQNGASSNGGKIQTNSTPLGGQIQVVNESQLPPIDIQTNIPGINGNGINLPGAAGAIAQASGGSSGMPPIFSGSGGGQGGGGQKSPFPMPQSSQSQSGQQGQQGQMPQSQQNQSGQQGQQGQMPQGQQQQQQQQQGQQSQSGQQGQQSQQQGQQGQMSQSGQPISAQLPPPPPEHSIGDQAAQIDPNGELQQSEGESGEEGSSSESSESSGNRRSGNSMETQGDESSESDGQAMPDDIGGSSGSKRGTGTIDDVAVPTNL